MLFSIVRVNFYTYKNKNQEKIRILRVLFYRTRTGRRLLQHLLEIHGGAGI